MEICIKEEDFFLSQQCSSMEASQTEPLATKVCFFTRTVFQMT